MTESLIVNVPGPKMYAGSGIIEADGKSMSLFLSEMGRQVDYTAEVVYNPDGSARRLEETVRKPRSKLEEGLVMKQYVDILKDLIENDADYKRVVNSGLAQDEIVDRIKNLTRDNPKLKGLLETSIGLESINHFEFDDIEKIDEIPAKTGRILLASYAVCRKIDPQVNYETPIIRRMLDSVNSFDSRVYYLKVRNLLELDI